MFAFHPCKTRSLLSNSPYPIQQAAIIVTESSGTGLFTHFAGVFLLPGGSFNFKAKHSGTQRAASTKHRVSFVRRFGVRTGSSVFRKAAAIGCTKIGTYLFGRGTSLSRWKRDAAYSVPSC